MEKIVAVTQMSYQTRLMHYETEKQMLLRKAQKDDSIDVERILQAIQKRWKI